VWKSALQLINKIRGEKARQEVAPFVLSSERVVGLKKLESRLGYDFRDRGLLERALTHKSYSNESGLAGSVDYESLEFLGDSILGFVISEFLYLTYPELTEGDLSKIKSQLVSAQQLHLLSRDLKLGEYLNLSRGEDQTGGRYKKALLADLFESLAAAIYLDGGIEAARIFILREFRRRFEDIARDEMPFKDHKSALQEQLHGLGFPSPAYEVVRESGPDHKKKFLVSVSSEGTILAHGSGGSKKAAEQEAAELAIAKIAEMPSKPEES
jgi:ribonuclease-3